ncbi:HTH_Tnp_Tc3_2 domain-containing protein [Trichonephila clavipes]|nr:HTH_Tnp_Tc3_2 domain-containing protein [Trichonephila clavipes]
MPSRRRRSHYKQLIEFERGRVKGLREGVSLPDIAERLERNVSAVHDCWEQWSRESTDARRSGSWRPHSTTEREDHRIWRTAVVHYAAFVAEILAAVGTTVKHLTVRNWLFQGQLRARFPVGCIPLTPSHCLLRRQWCRANVHWKT